jgi:hypothetical protein
MQRALGERDGVPSTGHVNLEPGERNLLVDLEVRRRVGAGGSCQADNSEGST